MQPEAVRRFIGRQSELHIIRGELETAVAGQARIVMLAGEPGIGKTRTAQEMVRHAEQCGVLSLWGRCPEEPGAPPYWPWLQLIRRYVMLHDTAVVRESMGPAATYIAALDPALIESQPDDTRPWAETDGVNSRFRLFDSIAAFWQRVAARQPLLLVFDDLHCADVPSLKLLEFVMAEASNSRLMVLGTYRDAEVTRQHPLSDSLAELHRHAQVQRLLLGGFTAAETDEFVAAAGLAAPELARALFAQTEGHPLFLAELARDWRQTQESGSGAITGAHMRTGRIPKGVREVIGARLNRQTPSCVRVLQICAVIGRQFRFDLLCRLLDGDPEEQCAAALQEARTASLVDESTEPGSYQFTHALVRDTLYDELPTTRRASLHQRIVTALEMQYRLDLTPCLSELAHHCRAAGAAGDAAKAIEYATRAAERASAMQAHEEAARHYSIAIAALAPETDAQRCRLLLGLGEAQISAGDSAKALGTFADASTHARRLGNATLLARAAIGFGKAQWRQGSEGSQACAMIEEALAAGTSIDTRERVLLLSASCRALLFSNRPDEAERAFREAVAVARRINEPLTLFEALIAIVPGRWFPHQLTLRIEAARDAVELAQRAPHLDWPVATLTGWYTGDLMEAGDTAVATAAARTHLATGKTTRDPFVEAGALAALAMIATHEGRFDDAERLAVQALRCGQRFDRANAAGVFGVQMFTLRRHQGRLPELAPVLKHFQDSQPLAATWRPGLAVLHCELGHRDAARAELERLARDGFGGIAPDAIRIASLAYLAEVCSWLGDASRAATLIKLLMPYAERNIVFGTQTACFGAGARLLGMLFATLSRWDEAAHQFEYALGFDARTGGRPWLAQSRCEYGAMLLRRNRPGDGQRARTLFDTALADAAELGMRGLEERLQVLRQQAGKAPDTFARVAGLSERELQVLRLIAAGKTNQEIAAALSRSPNTVAIHVRNILGKTQAANRAEAAAFAVRHGLLPPV